jgi:hypothetical protein
MRRVDQKWILLLLALAGVLAISIPALVETGWGPKALKEVSVNAGIGMIASLLVLVLANSFGAIRRADSLGELLQDLSRRPVMGTARLVAELGATRDYAEALGSLGVERVYRTRTEAYDAIGEEMRRASKIHIISGCLMTFWGIWREVLLERDGRADVDVVVLLMAPDSDHLVSRTAMDDRFLREPSLQMLEGFAAASRQISSQLSECYLYNYCAPASVWLIDDSIYVTPRFYAVPGGRGFCVKLKQVAGGLYDEVHATLVAAIEDARNGVLGDGLR